MSFDPNINTALVLLDRALEEIENGFVACATCGDQEDTKTLDFVDDLKLAKSELMVSIDNIQDLRAFRNNAFLAHPNIDIDIEHLTEQDA